MNAWWSEQSVAVKCAWVILDSATIAQISAMASNHWITTINIDGVITRGGLWNVCVIDIVKKDQFCGETKNIIHQDQPSDWIQGTQALSVLGMVLLAITTVLINSYMFLGGVKHSISLVYVSMLLSFSSAILTWLAVLIFGVRMRMDIPLSKVNWGYGACVAAAILTALSSVCLLCEFVHLQDMRANKHQFRRQQQRQIIAGAIGGIPQSRPTEQTNYPV